MRKLFVAAICGIAVLLSISGCIKKKQQIRVQYINAALNSPYLDYYLQGTKRASFIGYNICSNSNTADLLDNEACTADARLNDTLVTALKISNWKAGTHYTMVTYGQYSSLKTALLSDTVAWPTTGKFKVRFMHFGTDAPALDVYLNSTPIALNKVYYGTDSLNAIGDFTELNAGAYTIYVKNHATNQTLFSISAMGIEDNRILDMYATGTLADSIYHPFCLGYAAH